MVSGILAAALGLGVMVGWHARLASLIQVLPGLVPMQYNTALGFLLAGAGLVALATGRNRWSPGFGAPVALIGGLTLIQYLLALDLGIDEILMTHYVSVDTSHRGRMAPNTALCFVLVGMALTVGGAAPRARRGLMAVGWLGSLAAGLGLVAFSGYLTGLPTAYGWGQLTRMALHTSIGFITLGFGVVAVAWELELRRFAARPGWLPMVAGTGTAAAAIALWQALLMDRDVGDFAAHTVLAFGLVMSLALVIATAAAQNARRALAERRDAEERLARSEQRFRDYFEMGLVGFAETSPGKGWVRVNDQLCRMLGYSAEELSSKTWSELTHPDDLAADQAEFNRLLAGEIDGYSLEKRFIRKGGAELHTILSVRIQRRADGSPDYLFAILQDVTERNRANRALHRSEATLRAVIDSLPGIFYLFDADGRFLMWNRNMEAVSGRTAAEMAELHPLDLFEGDDRRLIGERIAKVFADGAAQARATLTATDGRRTPFLFSGLRFVLDGRPCLVGVGIDITAIRDGEESLARSNAELQRFAYIASHDLQEPLRTVGNFVQLLERRYADRLDDTAREYIDFAAGGAKRMGQLIRDLLEYSRIDTQGSAMEPVETGPLVARVIESLSAAIADADADVRVDGDLPAVVGDSAQLERLFGNLIGNAVKYRHPGRRPLVRVAARREDGTWVFSVADNGIGIEPEYHEKIFVIFQRLHGQGAYEGTGIGLAVCKHIVERHGGRIWLESTPGEGTTFLFALGVLDGHQ
ncbi:PAS domain S-box protein [Magnetospirillum sp. SS-4]|uniref:sensor histidine kinase n=1 Tax=Magnetospirillum sp. SS-4 TaxID=2681465 RepID=UPI001385A210|nr:PAS domain S-box protein [Magnetospirillum sp. SS-4]CAA7626065.1 putative PAS/PAC sensor signal transduction histidine kinase [Magnetospirillum sp. SS-4]